MNTTAAQAAIDLNATYTYTRPGDTQPTTITPKLRDRQQDGERIITVRGLAPLLADQIDSIEDDGRRLHTLEVLQSAGITISDQPGDYFTSMVTTRDSGRLATTYAGTHQLPVDAVLDLAEKIRAAL